MKLAPGLHIQWVEDEAVLLDERSGNLHYLNTTAALVYALTSELGFEAAIEKVKELHVRSPTQAEELDELIEQMRELGILLDE